MRYRITAALDWNDWGKTRQNSNQNSVLLHGRLLRGSVGDRSMGIGDVARRYERLHDVSNVRLLGTFQLLCHRYFN